MASPLEGVLRNDYFSKLSCSLLVLSNPSFREARIRPLGKEIQIIDQLGQVIFCFAYGGGKEASAFGLCIEIREISD